MAQNKFKWRNKIRITNPNIVRTKISMMIVMNCGLRDGSHTMQLIKELHGLCLIISH